MPWVLGPVLQNCAFFVGPVLQNCAFLLTLHVWVVISTFKKHCHRTLRVKLGCSPHVHCSCIFVVLHLTCSSIWKYWSKAAGMLLILRCICRSGTDLLLLIILFLFLLGWPSSKKPKAPLFQIGVGWNLAKCSASKYVPIDGVGFNLTSQDGSHDVISHRKLPHPNE